MRGKVFACARYDMSVEPDADDIVVRPVADRCRHEVGASCAAGVELEPGSALWLLSCGASAAAESAR